MSVWSWLLGLIISLGAGSYATPRFLDWLRSEVDEDELRKAKKEQEVVPMWVTGLLERSFFTVAVAFNVPGTAVAMVAWLAAKMAANWNRQEHHRLFAVSSLLAGLLSMSFALVGGLIVRGG